MIHTSTPKHGKVNRSAFNTKSRKGVWLNPHPAHEALVAAYAPEPNKKKHKESH